MGVTFPLERAEQVTVFAVAVVFAVLSVAAVALRLLSRQKLGRWLDASDYLMIGSCVSRKTIRRLPDEGGCFSNDPQATTVGLSVIIVLGMLLHVYLRHAKQGIDFPHYSYTICRLRLPCFRDNWKIRSPKWNTDFSNCKMKRSQP